MDNNGLLFGPTLKVEKMIFSLLEHVNAVTRILKTILSKTTRDNQHSRTMLNMNVITIQHDISLKETQHLQLEAVR
jgi:hypothetical protein